MVAASTALHSTSGEWEAEYDEKCLEVYRLQKLLRAARLEGEFCKRGWQAGKWAELNTAHKVDSVGDVPEDPRKTAPMAKTILADKMGAGHCQASEEYRRDRAAC